MLDEGDHRSTIFGAMIVRRTGMIGRLGWLLLLLALGVPASTLATWSAQATDEAGGPVLVQIRPVQPGVPDLVQRGLDIWETSPDRALALVDDSELARLVADGYSVLIDYRFPANRRRAAASSFGPGGYPTYDQIVAEMHAVADRYPALVRLVDLGQSGETLRGDANRRVWAVRVTAPNGPPRPAVLYLAAYHAREVVTPELALQTLHMYADAYGRDPLVTELLDTLEVWIVPVVNPDGWVRVERGAEWWRKSTTPTSDCGIAPGTNANNKTPGVDLNRNHSFGWNGPEGASALPCSETYRGPAPASEAETRIIERLFDRAGFVLAISWHAYGNLVLWPWASRADNVGADPVLDTIGAQLMRLTGYRGGPGGSTLYLSSGELSDWAWVRHRVPVFTIEVGAASDSLDHNPFTPPHEAVLRYWTANQPAALYLARIAGDLRRADAPDIVSPTVVTSPGNDTIEVTGILTPVRIGTAAGAELFVDRVGAEGTGLAGTLSADGTRATWRVSAAGLALGEHAFWVRARDGSGTWGPLAVTSTRINRTSIFLPSTTRRVAVSG